MTYVPEARGLDEEADTEFPDSLQLLLRDAARYPLLTAAEEVALAQRIERGDRGARERMILCNLRLVVSVAKGFRAPGVQLVDVVQDGTIGLMRAVDKFDWRQGFKFSTYAIWWIRQSIQRGLATHARAIRLPVHVLERERRLLRVEEILTRELGRTPTREEVAEAAEVTMRQLRAVELAPHASVSLSTPLGEWDDGDLAELLAIDAPAPDDEIEALLAREAIAAAVDALPEREAEVIRLRFALAGGEARTLREVGSSIGVTRERARQIEARALEHLATATDVGVLREAV